MKKKIFLISLIVLIGYLTVNYSINKNSFSNLKKYLSSENKFLIKKYLFPYKYQNQLENEILQYQSRSPINNVLFSVKRELKFKKSLENF